MTGSNEAVKKVLQAFDDNEWAEIHLSYGEVEIHLSATGGRESARETSHDLARSAGNEVARTASTTTSEDAAPGAGRTSEESGGRTSTSPSDDAELNDSVEVTSPTPGIFWRAPSPGAPPFVEVGGRVTAGDPLCIVEVMKLMSTMSAPVDGTVVRIAAENGEQVESQRVLFHIVPGDR